MEEVFSEYTPHTTLTFSIVNLSVFNKKINKQYYSFAMGREVVIMFSVQFSEKDIEKQACSALTKQVAARFGLGESCLNTFLWNLSGLQVQTQKCLQTSCVCLNSKVL